MPSNLDISKLPEEYRRTAIAIWNTNPKTIEAKLARFLICASDACSHNYWADFKGPEALSLEEHPKGYTPLFRQFEKPDTLVKLNRILAQYSLGKAEYDHKQRRLSFTPNPKK